MTRFRLLVGLGNAGRGYAATRHNAGFWWADAIAARLGATFANEAKFSGDVAKATGDVRLLKPATYMNLSGRAVATLARFFDIAPEEILVAHDELDLLPGAVRLKQGGGHAGHNGLRDIQQQLGSTAFWRLRLGIGHPRDSEIPQQDVADYVLKPPRTEELRAIEDAIARALEAWPLLAQGDMAQATMRLHTDPASVKAAKSSATSVQLPTLSPLPQGETNPRPPLAGTPFEKGAAKPAATDVAKTAATNVASSSKDPS
ncbi:MAG: aminoacyl-tRNA hydrolase [Burkholderiales bacterium]|jgi:PTH1 family peptidyl-tRNA hydrolase|nr:aminoacyl-tRNA hydrolase [Burkholderiales bacterium]